MKRFIPIAAVVALLVGIMTGYLWWGVRGQQQLNDAQAQALVVQAELKASQERLKALEQELRSERDRRAKLEEIVTKGRK